MRRPTLLLALATLVLAPSANAAPAPGQLLSKYAPVVLLHPDERFGPVPVEGFLGESALERRTDGTWEPADLPALPADAGPWRLNQGTCESVTIVLSLAGRPLLAGYSQHCSGKRRAWSRVPKEGTHPLVYVALGSHSNWFGPGDHAIDTRCYPQVARVVFDAYLPSVLDRNGAAGRVRPSVVRVTETAPEWMRFRGTWGEDGFFHAPDPVNTVRFEAGPAGPAFQEKWRDPLGTVTRWPAG